MAAGPGGPLINESLWVALSFGVFVALVWKKAGSAISAALDKRSEDIRNNLDEAKTLREEAQNELQKYQRLQREATDQAKEIIANAEKAALQIEEAAKKNAEASIKRRKDQAEAKIKALEAEATQDIRNRAAQLATAAAADLIRENMDQVAANNLLKADIEAIKSIN
ncbi:MAG: F0F1 ATP synthase subunit B [Proteobacteria bacterium]|jgi:F-type H+-transporting ATPase subunit b|nr:F0F1 ATP synthase subunit B [Pseudomonadota bacterium]MDA0908492.1 F0F1 ATP synthase subunit B [Pseudomonadota bacterium]NBR38091.1 ATP synthase F0 subunit B [Alphaproteobacteria bacterium]